VGQSQENVIQGWADNFNGRILRGLVQKTAVDCEKVVLPILHPQENHVVVAAGVFHKGETPQPL